MRTGIDSRIDAFQDLLEQADTKQKALLVSAAKQLHVEMMDDVVYYAPELWPGKSRWTLPVPMEMMTTDATYVAPNWNDYQSRGATFYFYFAPPASLAESKSTTYIKGALDAEGRKLNGPHDYTITIPADVPAKRFWSMLTYATKDGTYIRESNRIGIASNEEDIVKNKDGSTTLIWSSKSDGKVNCMPVIDGEDIIGASKPSEIRQDFCFRRIQVGHILRRERRTEGLGAGQQCGFVGLGIFGAGVGWHQNIRFDGGT